ncbi:MAG TPA: hypothetical protein ENI80_05745 [Acidiferrobacteraceae bacterium]|nr:hypothetical protein [Acidiferrobacteraceae bacterium]
MSKNSRSNKQWWDPHSDQPYRITPAQKHRLAPAALGEYAITLLTALSLSPAIGWRYLFDRPNPTSMTTRQFVGLGISLDAGYPDEAVEMVNELGVKELLLRVPVWDLERIDEYVAYAGRFQGCRFLINVLQHRDSVRDHNAWRESLRTIFENFKYITTDFQIGNASNRSKWGCRHTGEYLRLLEIAEEVREKYPDIRLVGPSVIDFEPLAMIRALLNRRHYHLDKVSALLYVNRRGAPVNRQFGIFDLKAKLRLFNAIASLSGHGSGKLWITEFNWPLLDTKPYTPNSGRPQTTVDPELQAHCLKDYYRIARQSGCVEKVYWWQLIAPGYGLVDSRGGQLQKRPAYYALKALLRDSEI